ncbi:LOB DOMAIN-CONTAINING PROTEIN 19 [Salix koriyanagi]|uniref:LOB DOMAIN-CONTAINING PROTEIN 19 n=1 Tax=Salix koriyanagi TaxID=2511006 RepID=A0A9Q0TE87_9ROSI|nr:LOB DOMAIN-CONTAINING PROTEIN 19 [Salix koriyanagi]
MMSAGASNGSGPCGACKFLRRKCVRGCIFAPYFDPDQGTAHFAAVHKVFGASNASKLLLRIPAPKRPDAVVTLSYEALARVRDPVYGCVGHIFALQQQVVNLQAELAYIQAHLPTLQCLPSPQPPPLCPQSHSLASLGSSSEVPSFSKLASNSNISMHFDELQLQPQQASTESTGFCDPSENGIDNEDLHELARAFVSRCLPGVRPRPPNSP